MSIQTSMPEQNPGGLTTAGFPGLPGSPLDDCMVARLANELFKETPAAPPAGEQLLSAAYTAAPDVPGIGGGPLTPEGYAVPATAGGPSSGISTVVPDISGYITPAGSLGLPGQTTGLPGNVPQVGENGFLSNIGNEVDPGFITPPAPAVESGTAEPEQGKGAEQPLQKEDNLFSKIDLLSLGLSGVNLSGAPLTETGSQFYFLPSTTPEKAEPEKKTAYQGSDVRRDFPALHQKINGKPLIWLDNGATTHKPQSVIDAVSHFYSHDNSNIHRGAHTLAVRATDAYEGAREKVQHYLGAGSKSEIIFTKGATEAINLVAQAWGRKNVGPGDEVLVSTFEHHANIVPWQFLVKEKGAVLKVIPIDDDGQIILEEYERLLNSRTKIVAIAQVSNVLGTVPPIAIMAQLAHRYGAKVLVDGAQGAPHLPTNVLALDADFYALAGHKLFAPTGIGVLYGKSQILEDMPPWQGGGSMIESVTFESTVFNPPPAKFEAGTPPIAGAIGLGAAIDYINRFSIGSIAAYEEGLMSYATAALSTIPGLRQIGTTPDKVGALAFVIPGIKTEEIGRHLDNEGIAVRAGHHCAQPALKRFGLTAAVRPSISMYNTTADIDALVAALRKLKR